MNSRDLLIDAFGRIHELVHDVLDDATAEIVQFRPDPPANSVAWLVWHLTRVEDDHIAGAANTDQIWLTTGWAERFGLPFDVTSTGYGHRPQEVAAVTVAPNLLLGYHDAVHEMVVEYLGGLDDRDFDRIVDQNWRPPVTLAMRVISVISDALQHAGQAAFVRGLAERSG
jgi:hypothetical protein